MATKLIQPARLADAIAEHIQQLITEGALQAGERLLSERELSIKLEVSRPTLREALAKLIELGLLRADARGSAYVSESLGKSIRDPLALLMDKPNSTFDYLEFRHIIEGEAASYAAQRASEPDRDAIKHHFERMRAAHRKDDPDEHAKADADFHLAIYDASHNLIILHIMRSLETMLRSNVFLNRKNLYEYFGVRTTLFGEHEAIFNAIMKRDPEAARTAAQYHVDGTLKTLREIQESEKRLQVSIRRLERSDLVVPKKVATKSR